jgi:hypothetical protein
MLLSFGRHSFKMSVSILLRSSDDSDSGLVIPLPSLLLIIARIFLLIGLVVMIVAEVELPIF